MLVIGDVHIPFVNLICTLDTDTGDFFQPFRFTLNHPQCIFSKMVNDFLCNRRSHTRYKVAGQKFYDSVFTAARIVDFRVTDGDVIPTEFLVFFPSPVIEDFRTRNRIRYIPFRSAAFSLPFLSDFKDSKSCLRLIVDDRCDFSLERKSILCILIF